MTALASHPQNALDLSQNEAVRSAITLSRYPNNAPLDGESLQKTLLKVKQAIEIAGGAEQLFSLTEKTLRTILDPDSSSLSLYATQENLKIWIRLSREFESYQFARAALRHELLDIQSVLIELHQRKANSLLSSDEVDQLELRISRFVNTAKRYSTDPVTSKAFSFFETERAFTEYAEKFAGDIIQGIRAKNPDYLLHNPTLKLFSHYRGIFTEQQFDQLLTTVHKVLPVLIQAYNQEIRTRPSFQRARRREQLSLETRIKEINSLVRDFFENLFVSPTDANTKIVSSTQLQKYLEGLDQLATVSANIPVLLRDQILSDLFMDRAYLQKLHSFQLLNTLLTATKSIELPKSTTLTDRLAKCICVAARTVGELKQPFLDDPSRANTSLVATQEILTQSQADWSVQLFNRLCSGEPAKQHRELIAQLLIDIQSWDRDFSLRGSFQFESLLQIAHCYEAILNTKSFGWEPTLTAAMHRPDIVACKYIDQLRSEIVEKFGYSRSTAPNPPSSALDLIEVFRTRASLVTRQTLPLATAILAQMKDPIASGTLSQDESTTQSSPEHIYEKALVEAISPLAKRLGIQTRAGILNKVGGDKFELSTLKGKTADLDPFKELESIHDLLTALCANGDDRKIKVLTGIDARRTCQGICKLYHKDPSAVASETISTLADLAQQSASRADGVLNFLHHAVNDHFGNYFTILRTPSGNKKALTLIVDFLSFPSIKQSPCEYRAGKSIRLTTLRDIWFSTGGEYRDANFAYFFNTIGGPFFQELVHLFEEIHYPYQAEEYRRQLVYWAQEAAHSAAGISPNNSDTSSLVALENGKQLIRELTASVRSKPKADFELYLHSAACKIAEQYSIAQQPPHFSKISTTPAEKSNNLLIEPISDPTVQDKELPEATRIQSPWVAQTVGDLAKYSFIGQSLPASILPICPWLYDHHQQIARIRTDPSNPELWESTPEIRGHWYQTRHNLFLVGKLLLFPNQPQAQESAHLSLVKLNDILLRESGSRSTFFTYREPETVIAGIETLILCAKNYNLPAETYLNWIVDGAETVHRDTHRVTDLLQLLGMAHIQKPFTTRGVFEWHTPYATVIDGLHALVSATKSPILDLNLGASLWGDLGPFFTEARWRQIAYQPGAAALFVETGGLDPDITEPMNRAPYQLLCWMGHAIDSTSLPLSRSAVVHDEIVSSFKVLREQKTLARDDKKKLVTQEREHLREVLQSILERELGRGAAKVPRIESQHALWNLGYIAHSVSGIRPAREIQNADIPSHGDSISSHGLQPLALQRSEKLARPERRVPTREERRHALDQMLYASYEIPLHTAALALATLHGKVTRRIVRQQILALSAETKKIAAAPSYSDVRKKSALNQFRDFVELNSTEKERASLKNTLDEVALSHLTELIKQLCIRHHRGDIGSVLRELSQHTAQSDPQTADDLAQSDLALCDLILTKVIPRLSGALEQVQAFKVPASFTASTSTAQHEAVLAVTVDDKRILNLGPGLRKTGTATLYVESRPTQKALWCTRKANVESTMKMLTTKLVHGRTVVELTAEDFESDSTLGRALERADYVFISYEQLRSRFRIDPTQFAVLNGWLARKQAALVLDEAHVLDNIRSKSAQAVLTLNAPDRLVCTGTAFQHRASKGVAALLQIMFPHRFEARDLQKEFEINPGAARAWFHRYATVQTPEDVSQQFTPFEESSAQEQLAGGMLRIPRQNIVHHNFTLHPEQEREYYSILDDDGTVGLRQMVQMRKAVLAVSDHALNYQDGLFQKTVALVETFKAKNETYLITSEYLPILEALKQKLRVPLLRGTMPMSERDIIIEELVYRRSIDGIIGQTQVVGTGLNLPGVDHIVILHPPRTTSLLIQTSTRHRRLLGPGDEAVAKECANVHVMLPTLSEEAGAAVSQPNVLKQEFLDLLDAAEQARLFSSRDVVDDSGSSVARSVPNIIRHIIRHRERTQNARYSYQRLSAEGIATHQERYRNSNKEQWHSATSTFVSAHADTLGKSISEQTVAHLCGPESLEAHIYLDLGYAKRNIHAYEASASAAVRSAAKVSTQAQGIHFSTERIEEGIQKIEKPVDVLSVDIDGYITAKLFSKLLNAPVADSAIVMVNALVGREQEADQQLLRLVNGHRPLLSRDLVMLMGMQSALPKLFPKAHAEEALQTLQRLRLASWAVARHLVACTAESSSAVQPSAALSSSESIISSALLSLALDGRMLKTCEQFTYKSPRGRPLLSTFVVLSQWSPQCDPHIVNLITATVRALAETSGTDLLDTLAGSEVERLRKREPLLTSSLCAALSVYDGATFISSTDTNHVMTLSHLAVG